MLAQGLADAVHGLAQAGEDDGPGRVPGLAGGCVLPEVLPDNVKQGGHLRVWAGGGSHQMVQAHLELQGGPHVSLETPRMVGSRHVCHEQARFLEAVPKECMEVAVWRRHDAGHAAEEPAALAGRLVPL